MLVFAEVGLQARGHFRFGASVFSVISGDTTYRYNKTYGLKLLRPSAAIVGSDATIETNSYGLRSPEIPLERAPNSIRIAIVGASTVMGTDTSSNQEISAYVLERELTNRHPRAKVDVINAGILGFTLAEEKKMIEELVTLFKPDVIILYTGFNDISGYCDDDAAADNAPKAHPLNKVSLPRWVLSYQLLLKNTPRARETAVKPLNAKVVAELNTGPYETDLSALVASAKKHAAHVLLSTNARSFRRDMPRDEQMALSTTARFYNSCFDLDGLHDVYDAHNAIIDKVATAQHVPLVPMDTMMPPGRAYFSDGNHFTPKGEIYAARIFAKYLEQYEMIK